MKKIGAFIILFIGIINLLVISRPVTVMADSGILDYLSLVLELTDEDGNFILSDLEEQIHVKITPLIGYIFSEDSDFSFISFKSMNPYDSDGFRNIIYTLSVLADEITEDIIRESFENSKQYYGEDYGYSDCTFNAFKVINTENNQINYATITYCEPDYIWYKWCYAYTLVDDRYIQEVHIYEEVYSEDGSKVDEDFIKMCMEAVKE